MRSPIVVPPILFVVVARDGSRKTPETPEAAGHGEVIGISR
jgi:hypothetical protein